MANGVNGVLYIPLRKGELNGEKNHGKKIIGGVIPLCRKGQPFRPLLRVLNAHACQIRL